MSFAPLSVLVFDEYDIPSNPTWTADVQPVMDQYMRMYPGMKSILDMSGFNTVQQNAGALKAVFSADAEPSEWRGTTMNLTYRLGERQEAPERRQTGWTWRGHRNAR